MRLTDQQIKDSLRVKIKEAYEEYLIKVKGYKLALQALGDDVDAPLIPSHPKKVRKTRVNNTGSPTLSKMICETLTEAGKPLTARELMNIINSRYNKEYDFNKNFSGAFSQAYKRAEVTKIEVKGAGRSNKNVYALQEWTMNDSELKPEFRDKVEIKSEDLEEVPL